MLSRSDFTYSHGHTGYMLFFRGKPIGGAGTMPTEKKKHWRHVRADVTMFKQDAEREINALVEGRGQQRFLDIIANLQEA